MVHLFGELFHDPAHRSVCGAGFATLDGAGAVGCRVDGAAILSAGGKEITAIVVVQGEMPKRVAGVVHLHDLMRAGVVCARVLRHWDPCRR